MNTEERESEPAKSREGGNHDYELNRLIKSGTLMDALLPLLLAWLTWNNLGRQLLDNGSLIHLMLNTNRCEATREGCMGNLEKLTSSAAVAVEDIARINKHVLTPDNLELLKDSVSTLVKTLKHIEDISDNVSDMVGDNSTQANIKQLIQSLSRILVD